MKIKIRKGIIYNMDDDTIIGTLVTDSEETERIFELGAEAVPVIEEFVANVRSGSFKPRSEVKKFEALLEKYAI